MATPAATITMSMREADRLKTIQAVMDRMARVGQAAQRLGLSRRQLERLIQRYQDEGVAGLVSRKRGRPSNHQLAPGIAERAIGLIRERYADFGPTLACEKLTERHGLTLGRDRASADDGGRSVDAPQTTRGQDPPASQPPGVRRRVDPDRRQRPRLVRGA
jgi:hypothetical protein